MLNVKVSIPDLQKFAKEMPETFRKSVLDGLRKAMFVAEAGAKKLAPVKTGHLRRSIHSGVEDVLLPTGFTGSDVIYARIQELGGTILPKNGKYLRFKIGNQWVTTKSVTIKGKFYLEKGMTNNLDRMIDKIRNSVIDAMEGRR